MYNYLKSQLASQFDTICTLKQTGQKTICRIRHKKSGVNYLMRDLTGSGDVYQKLLPFHSPHLPQILEVAADEDGKRFLVLEEWIEGDLLSEMLKGALFSPRETRRIALDVCRGLSLLHDLGIVHRDVKPENIKLRGSHAVLMDFDVSRMAKEDQTADTCILGTTGYAPPEQYGISQTDGRTDIYALGITMNLMLTGTHPSVRTAPGRLGRVISRCTQIQPSRRYADIRELMEALDL